MHKENIKSYHRSVWSSKYPYGLLIMYVIMTYQVIKHEMYLDPFALSYMVVFLLIFTIICARSLYYILLTNNAIIVKHHLFNTNRVYYFSDIKAITLKSVRGGVFVSCLVKNNIKKWYICDTITLNKHQELKDDLLQRGVYVIDKL